MYLKKKATVLISTVIILSLMSILGCCMFKMMKNNSEMSNLCKFNKDIYDLGKDEEEVLNEFMKKLNKSIADNQNNQNDNEKEKNYEDINNELISNKEKLENKSIEEKDDNQDIFSKDFKNTIEDSVLEYHTSDDKIFLITNKNNEIVRKREIKYIFKDEKIILIPTYKFENNSK